MISLVAELFSALRQAVQRSAGYYRWNRRYRHDDEYLARGCPTGTDMVERACRHFVNDRIEQSGIRWTTERTQAVLDLQTVRFNGHWEAYW